MWIPHFGYTFWQKKGKAIKKSEKDSSERKFEIVFHLEDPENRAVKTSRIKLAKTTEKLQTEVVGKKKIETPILFENNEKGYLSRIRCLVQAKNKIEATSYAYNSVSQLLSVTTFSTSIPLAIWAIVALDKKHKVAWEAKPQISKAEPFFLPEGIHLDENFKAIFSIYREGKNNPSPFYRFFCFVKILEGFYKSRLLFSEGDKIIKKHPGLKRKKKRIDKELLIYALAYPKYKDLIGKTYPQLWNWIHSNYRHLIAHTFPKKELAEKFLNLDNYQLYTEFAIIGNITELVVRNVIIDELELWKTFLEKKIVTI